MPLIRIRRYLYNLYRAQPVLIRRQAEFSLLVWVLLAGLLIARLTIRLSLQGPALDTACRTAGYVLLLGTSLWLLLKGNLTWHINILAIVCFAQCLVLFPSEISRQFFSLSLFSMMAFAVLSMRRYHRVVAFGIFPALATAKGVYELVRERGEPPFVVGVEDTVLTLLVFAASVPLVLFLIELVGREIRRTEALRGENRTLKREVGTDALTGAWSRRQFDKLTRQQIAQAERSGQPLALALLDIDKFKRVNDRFGHLTGDQVLSRTADAMIKVLRQGDLLVRWGGDEFVVIFPGAGAEVALGLGEKLVSAVANDPYLRQWKTGISVGVSVWRPGESAKEWLERADHAMYQAKSDGRVRVRVADNDGSLPPL